MSTTAGNNGGDDVIITLDHVYKIFGPQPRGRALKLAKDGLSKNEVQAATDHVVGMTDVTFDVYRGETFVIMGLSGSGKSTAIRTVNKLHDITDGRVLVDGTNVQELEGPDLQKFRQKMGMVFQHFALFPHRTVIDNTGYGLKVQGVDKETRDAASLEALSLVGLAAFAQSYPSELSGGMQQRVGLARALASDPDVLLMDEAFSALDPLIRRQMQDEMMAIQAELQKTILFITHDLNEALRIGDRVCIMKDGAVVQIGTPDEILTKPATGYVAEFVQDVDQGRVIDVATVMSEPITVDRSMSATDILATVGNDGGFVLDADGRPTELVMASDVYTAATGGTGLDSAFSSEFDLTTADAKFNHVYATAGKGRILGVVDGDGRLVGVLRPKDMIEEMGRVESLIDDFEREVFM